MFPKDIVIKNGYSYVVGYLYEDIIKGLFIKFNNSTGNIVWANLDGFNGGEIEFANIFNYEGNSLCLMGSHNLNPNDTSLVLIADTAGNITSSKYLRFPTSAYAEHDLIGKAAMTSNNEIIWSPFNYDANFIKSSAMLIKFTPEAGIIWA